ncbi:hypothetical protein [Phyllobacterium brassicacearum]|nr:hypothetical protein [Phyllobacterium brassicacearum]TDQ19915.1 hypothetical protein DEV91_124110 [Phyllobacterium brassicacearum]
MSSHSIEFKVKASDIDAELAKELVEARKRVGELENSLVNLYQVSDR